MEIVGGPEGPGLASEWEVSFLGLRKKVGSVLEEDEPPRFLRWSYAGPIRGWGECEISPLGSGALARFETELRPEDPALERLARTSAARSAATTHLKRCLARLGQAASGDGARVRVGPLEMLGQEAGDRRGQQKEGGTGAPPSLYRIPGS